MKIRELLTFLVVSVMAVSFSSCDGEIIENPVVGLAFCDAADNFSIGLRELQGKIAAQGYAVKTEVMGRNERDANIQVAQIEKLISENVNILVIAAYDQNSLTPVYQKAREAGIKTITFDRFPMKKSLVDFVVTFSSMEVGQLMAESIIVGATETDKYQYFMEYLMGPENDYNSTLIYNGAESTFYTYQYKPTVKSGKIAFDDVKLSAWDEQEACDRFKELLKNYEKGELDFVFCASDKLSDGCVQALEELGYAPEEYPMITGQDATKSAVKRIIAGTQLMTLFKDPRAAATECFNAIEAFVKGEKPKANQYAEPTAYYVPVQVVTKDNYKEVLIDSGFYTMDDLK